MPSRKTTVFKGFFKYLVKSDSKNEPVVLAQGLRPPVEGVRIELESSSTVDQNLPQFAAPRTGQHLSETVNSVDDEAYLAQMIFRGEMGRYARSWTELSQITHFRFPIHRNISSRPRDLPLEIEPILPSDAIK